MNCPIFNNNTFTVRREERPNPIKCKMPPSPDAILDSESNLEANTKSTAEINEGVNNSADNLSVSGKRWSIITTGIN
jgi:hypothetical protein